MLQSDEVAKLEPRGALVSAAPVADNHNPLEGLLQALPKACKPDFARRFAVDREDLIPRRQPCGIARPAFQHLANN